MSSKVLSTEETIEALKARVSILEDTMETIQKDLSDAREYIRKEKARWYNCSECGERCPADDSLLHEKGVCYDCRH